MTLDPVQHTVSSPPLKHRLHVADSDMYSQGLRAIYTYDKNCLILKSVEISNLNSGMFLPDV
jgi:hypothetical protein